MGHRSLDGLALDSAAEHAQSLTQCYSVGFEQSSIDAQKIVFNKKCWLQKLLVAKVAKVVLNGIIGP